MFEEVLMLSTESVLRKMSVERENFGFYMYRAITVNENSDIG